MSGSSVDPSRVSAVALLTPGWPTLSNGIATYALAIHDALAELGVRTFLLARTVQDQGPGSLPADVINVAWDARRRPLPERLVDRVLARFGADRALAFEFVRSNLLALRRLHRERGVQLFEMEEGAGLAGRIARRAPVPVVVRLHGPWFLNGVARGVPQDEAYRRRDRLEGVGLTRVHGITAPSHDVLRRTREHFGLALADAVVIPNPMPVAPGDACWQPAAADPDRIAFIGRFDRHKAGDVVIDAFARVLERRPAARLVFVGPDRGLADAQGRPRQLEEYARERLGPRRDRLEWAGEQPMDAVPGFRRSAALTVVASRYENFPYAALEAMAMACPLVATDAGGLAEVVEDGRNALTCRASDPEALAERILALLDRPELAVRLGRQAREDCRERYAPDVVARATLAHYERVLDRARPRGRR